MSAPSRRRKRPEEPEEHVNHERWLVTYADMLTLLMVLFIIMFAMSQVSEDKYEALKSGLAVGFGGQQSVLNGASSVLEDDLSEYGTELVSSAAFRGMPADQQKMVLSALDSEEKRRIQATYAEAEAEAKRLEAVRDQLMAALRRAGLEKDVRTTIDDRGLVVSLVSRHVVFQPDIAQLSPRGQRVVDALAPVLLDVPNDLRIDGHTNQEPVKPRLFATDWDLSAARAVTVLRRLNERDDIPKRRLSLSAFGHERPLIDPDTPGSQEINKRVDIVVLPQTSVEATQLIDEVLSARPGGQGEEG
ncbi:OmpA/MotB family protein [Nocardioides sp. T2.26MG-1]|uniref:OmpA/MotB family protein n=1 Tax=Nocardioides sp. T2.26MG-1 TaxID=3041166 RepID=UPI0024776ECE|nr:flagellar motor protein MotB [Nocardioides sp. T2.26MG-1]CAI9399328.1 Chemotaxis protein LafU [Nocardioides sp. T2.26MG-1]